MRPRELALAQGIRDTRGALARWQANPGPVIGTWLGWSLVVACGLLAAVWAVASTVEPDPTPVWVPGIAGAASAGDVTGVVGRNSLVLALHALACVAGFMAGSSLAYEAQRRSGLSRVIHEAAGPVAIGWVVAVTAFSLLTQAYVLGSDGAALAAQLEISPAMLIVTALPHALPELVALFLPLAAWLVASRRGEWDELLAATVVTVALAFPILLVSATLEAVLWPELLVAASPRLS